MELKHQMKKMLSFYMNTREKNALSELGVAMQAQGGRK